MADLEPTLAATRLGAYTIVRKLARGGMAELFLARGRGPEGIERLVVLKTILPRYANNPRYVQLFLDEARLAASLDHPHIVPVYDVGHADGHHFFAMEYVHGQDLRAVLRRSDRSHRRTPIALAIMVARDVAAALHHAHERRRPDGSLHNIVHRDVSPSNILVSYEGDIKLADFGVAKTATSSVRTRTGTLKGKVGYMSPEQARGLPIDRRSDIFSLGVVLWELVTVRRLFKTGNDLATIQAIIHTAPPSLVDYRSDCPPELERIVNKALEKDPAKRYQTAEQLRHDLDELAHESGLELAPSALSVHVSELFEAELAAWREAQATGVTVTDFVVATEPHTPISESELSLEGASSFADADEDHDDEELEDEPDDDGADHTTLPPQPPLAGAIVNADPLDEATAIAPPPVMIADSTEPGPKVALDERGDAEGGTVRLAADPFEAPTHVVPNAAAFDVGPTAVSASPFRDEPPTVQAHRFRDEAATVPRAAPETVRSLDTITTVLGDPPVQTPPAGSPVAPPSVLVSPQTPPGGIPAMTYPPSGSQPPMPAPGSASQPPMPAWDPAAQPWAISDLTPQRRLVIYSIVTGTLIVLVVIIAIIAGD